MLRKQLIGVTGMAVAVLVIVWLAVDASKVFAWVRLPADDAADRLAFTARWLLAPGLTLLVGVVAAGRRGFYKDAIDGTRTPANKALEINLRYNTNTLEQTVLAAIAWVGLSLGLPHDRLVLIPVMASLFLVGRAAFWIGYLIYPMGRAFGMVLTVLPTLIAYMWLVWRTFSRG